MGRWRRLWPVGALGALALVLASCGVPTSAAPRPIPRGQVPYHLLSPQGPSGTERTTTPPLVAPIPSTIYLVGTTQRLQPATRSVASPPLLSTMEALLAAPSGAESAEGLTTAISNQVRLIYVKLRADQVAVVNFNAAFEQIANSEQVLAVAQVVYTATGVPGVAAVQFEIGGKPISVPTDANGAQVQKPVRRSQYVKEAPAGTAPAPPS